MTDQKKDPPLSIPDVIWAAARWIAKRELLIRIGMVVFFIGTGAVGVVWAQDAGVKYVAPLKVRIDATDAALQAHIIEESAARADDRRKADATEERNASRFAVLYDTMLTGRPQPRAEELKKPIVTSDGGQ